MENSDKPDGTDTPDPGAQQDIVAALAEGRVEGVAPDREPITTPLSHVFLTADRAFKLKRAVNLPYVDFSTLDRRYAACQAELEINHRLAARLYVGLRAITVRPDSGYELDGEGPVRDWLVEMRRFDQSRQFDELARHGCLTRPVLTQTADVIAAGHAEMPVMREQGHTADYRAVIAQLRTTEADGAARLDLAPSRDDLFAALDHELTHLDPLIEERRRAGKVRRTHGDLHLRNICLFEGRPVMFDALEFDERMATTDVLYDLAFLLMDLVRLDHGADANLVMNRYWDISGEEEEALALLPFFMALRATVRLAVAVQGGNLEEADLYRRLAHRLLHPARPVLLALGGLSGTGKSAVAGAVAPRLPGAAGARWLRSDVLRKQAAGQPPEGMPAEDVDYGDTARKRVYDEMFAHGRAAAGAGVSIVLDATFKEAERRKAAFEIGESLRGVWLTAPLQVRLERVQQRKNDASDADTAVAKAQTEPETLEEGWERIDATGTVGEVAEAVLSTLQVGEGA